MYGTKCSECHASVILDRTPSVKIDPNLWDRLEGTCVKCGYVNRRVLYKCRNCDENTVHRHERFDHEKHTQIFVCERCGTEKSIYIGFKKPYERTMM